MKSFPYVGEHQNLTIPALLFLQWNGGSGSWSEPKEGWKIFHIESKSFEIVLGGGGQTYGIQIIEEKKRFMHNMLLGREEATWLRSTAIRFSHYTFKQSFLGNFMESGKVYQIQKYKCGRLLYVAEYWGKINCGLVIEPEVRDSGWGLKDFS